ncbi:putative endochitinase [Leptomonas pyrrhocoris]|uniref:Putative endochitinase n=1 Tax=Leptomonas pyrrhocoris TaxID=157538 RepID=A0A0M9G0V7_LEPPY|nr:putative endochitinase [Leptomonas pyrrhocoris]KPA80120.1 putative endochitinase [Leptomonas pyrrhocoris]|eukprot:XP_015658559.1 putative endochitinase [Leptomonas pyrrhocoris]
MTPLDGGGRGACRGRRSALLAGFVVTMVLCAFPTVAVEDPSPNSIICTCRCCYQGGCSAITNVSWSVERCSGCTTKDCNDYISSQAVRAETARLFEGIQGEKPLTSGAVVVEECAVIAVLEAATCTTKSCKRTSTIKAECYDRNAPLTKYSVIFFVLFTIFAVVFGIIKNYIPAFQSLNEKYFNY